MFFEMKTISSVLGLLLLGMSITAGEFAFGALDAFPKKVPVPSDNPQTPDKINLGRTLFFDPRLSKDGTISCNSCHNVMLGGEDNRPHSAGVGGQLGGRSAPTVWNAAFQTVQFWDGRAKSLEEQAKGPLTNPIEMAMENHKLVVSRIQSIVGYQVTFKKVFPEKDPITIDNVAKAIASYERTLITPRSPVDRYLEGDKKALNKLQVRGMELVEKVGCTSCHNGPNYSGPAIPDGFYAKFPTYPGSVFEKRYKISEDTGRFQVTKKDSDKNMWRVPTWRNIALTAPYFHNGSVANLDEAVRVMAKTQLNLELVSDDVRAISAFLHGLTGEFPQQPMPRLPATTGETLTPQG